MILQTKELTTVAQQKHHKNHEVYKDILQEVYRRIKYKNSIGYKQLVYNISPVLLGKPLINIEHAGIYITRKLIAGEFKVQLMYNKLFIDWS